MQPSTSPELAHGPLLTANLADNVNSQRVFRASCVLHLVLEKRRCYENRKEEKAHLTLAVSAESPPVGTCTVQTPVVQGSAVSLGFVFSL